MARVTFSEEPLHMDLPLLEHPQMLLVISEVCGTELPLAGVVDIVHHCSTREVLPG